MSNRSGVFPLTREGHQTHWPPCGELPEWTRTFNRKKLNGDWVLRDNKWVWVPRG